MKFDEKGSISISSKERSYLKGLAMNLDPVFQLGKDSLSAEYVEAVREALEKRELVKIHVLKNNADDKHKLAETLAEATGSLTVQVIGNMIVLFRYQHDPNKRKIEL